MSNTIYRVKDNPTLQGRFAGPDDVDNYLAFVPGDLVTEVADHIGSEYVGDELVDARIVGGSLIQTLDRSSLEEVEQ
ncbi:hypothetical protein SEA_ANON_62 [Gordonia phage Anon]|nr:hypothetical protein SEA_ANON_62 [Gordonia phage Anon]